MEEGVGGAEPECCGLLSWEQVGRLDRVLTEVVAVHGRGNFPTLWVRLRDVVRTVRARLQARGVAVRDVRLNGSTASHVLLEDGEGRSYKDLDLIFRVDLPQEAGLQPQEAGLIPQEAGFIPQEAEFPHQEAGFDPPEAGFELVREVVLGCLRDFLPNGVSGARMSAATLGEAYAEKQVKVWSAADRWSLISLHNRRGRNVELKFVQRIRRQWEFSVDSFQIVLDPLLEAYERQPPGGPAPAPPPALAPPPAVPVESVYGDLAAALAHLRGRLIATRRPEEIRGGGLLKYCHLLARGFRAAAPAEMRQLQRYMCSRFFIDFPDAAAQRRVLHAYLRSHFAGEEAGRRYGYLLLLRRVVGESTVCLMGHERRQTLALISALALRVLAEHGVVPDAAGVTCYYQPAPYAQDPNFCPYYCGQTLQTWQPCS